MQFRSRRVLVPRGSLEVARNRSLSSSDGCWAMRERRTMQSRGSANLFCAGRASAYAELSEMKAPRLPTPLFLSLLGLLVVLQGCKKPGAVSAEKAKANVVVLSKATHSDVAEVRLGLPQGAKLLLPL